MNEDETVTAAILEAQGYPPGLIHALTSSSSSPSSSSSFSLRIWLVDNSYSMNEQDGHLLVSRDNNKKEKGLYTRVCSRWEELQECVCYHGRLAELLQDSTTFRLLNDPSSSSSSSLLVSQIVNIGVGDDTFDKLEYTMKNSRPCGVTPLVQHLIDIHATVKGMYAKLKEKQQKVCIIIATDGLPTNEDGYGGVAANREFVQALKMLQGLPVWIVIRLCTDVAEVVSFYNDLDQQLEVSIEVLDDFMSEAKEVCKCNPWLTYSLCLHRCREYGFHDRLLDLLDERPFTKYELKEFCQLLFGEHLMRNIPDPDLDWDCFKQELKVIMNRQHKQWDPIQKRNKPWIDLRMLDRRFNPRKTSLFWYILAASFVLVLARYISKDSR